MGIEMTEVTQVLPEKRRVEFEGLYLRANHNLKGVYRKIKSQLQRPLVVTNYITDKKGSIALKDADGPPPQIKNDFDWKESFQPIQAQADIIITGKDYLKRFEKKGEEAQNILNQFDEGQPFAKLGSWRLKNGYKTRNPDVAIVSRSLDFDLPEEIMQGRRKIFVFTTYDMKGSEKALELKGKGVEVIGAGNKGVDGAEIIEELGKIKDNDGERKYQVIKMTTGPRVLDIFLAGNVLDRLYITQVQTDIKGKPENLITVPGGRGEGSQPEGFKLIEKYVHEGAVAKNGQTITQHFLVFENQNLTNMLNATSQNG